MLFWTLSRSSDLQKPALVKSGGYPAPPPRRGALRLLAGLAGLLCGLPAWPAATGIARRSFEPDSLESALQKIGATGASPSAEIQLQLPDVAEDGAAVQMSLTTTLPATRALVLVRKNRIPLVAEFGFPPGVLPFVATRIKMAEDSEVLALVEAGGRWYSASRQVKVTLGGCGG
jgi:sulfur-oxidizing protein SoxY